MKAFEFWHPRIFEAPYYASLLLHCLRKGITPRQLAKANYALDHGELGLGSKFTTQMAFDQSRFLATQLVQLPGQAECCSAFAKQHGLPLILKPVNGAVGKGVIKIADEEALLTQAKHLRGSYLLQEFCPHPEEYGIFFVRRLGQSRITGINKKHFPEITGNGHDSIGSLARAHPRYSGHWPMFLKYLDQRRIPAAGERVRLSFIGSHTMGCKFSDDTHMRTPALEAAIFAVCDSQPGFNFGRLDVKTASLQALQQGEFTVIEINGVASLPTHMFDPDNSLARAYGIFFEHARLLADIAAEHQHQPMALLGYVDLIHRARSNAAELNAMHNAAVYDAPGAS